MLELQNQPMTEGGQALTEAEICVQVLGSRSGYVKGLGHGPRRPPSSSRSRHAKSHREIELENELKPTRELIQSQETRIQHQQSQIDQLASFVSEMHQHICTSKDQALEVHLLHMTHHSWIPSHIYGYRSTWFCFLWALSLLDMYTWFCFFGDIISS